MLIACTAPLAGQRQRNAPEHYFLRKLRLSTMLGDSIVAACFGCRWRRKCEFATHTHVVHHLG